MKNKQPPHINEAAEKNPVAMKANYLTVVLDRTEVH